MFKCKHDWEVAHTTNTKDVIRKKYRHSDVLVSVIRYNDEWVTVPEYKRDWLDQKVCLKCGACKDEIKDYVDWLDKTLEDSYIADLKHEKRKSLARRKWADRCGKENN